MTGMGEGSSRHAHPAAYVDRHEAVATLRKVIEFYRIDTHGLDDTAAKIQLRQAQLADEALDLLEQEARYVGEGLDAGAAGERDEVRHLHDLPCASRGEGRDGGREAHVDDAHLPERAPAVAGGFAGHLNRHADRLISLLGYREDDLAVRDCREGAAALEAFSVEHALMRDALQEIADKAEEAFSPRLIRILHIAQDALHETTPMAENRDV